jgi:hypothetical protein
MLAEIGADEVERYGIDTRIRVGKDKADNLQGVPVVIVVFLRVFASRRQSGTTS